MEVARLARRGAGDAERDRARHDRGRQEDRRDDAADDAPLEAGPGAVVGHLLDVESAFLVRLDHEDAVDLEEARDLGVDEIVIRAHRQGRVGETGDDERVGALGNDCALGDDTVRRGRLGRVWSGHIDTSAPRGRRIGRREADHFSCARDALLRLRRPSGHVGRMRGHPDVRTVGRVGGEPHPPRRRKALDRQHDVRRSFDTRSPRPPPNRRRSGGGSRIHHRRTVCARVMTPTEKSNDTSSEDRLSRRDQSG